MKHVFISTLVTVFLAAQNISAALVVDWGGMDYLPATSGVGVKNFQGGGNSPAGVDNGTTRTWAYDASIPLSPTPATPAYSGTSATFYGAMQLTYAAGPASYVTARVDNNNDVSRLNISTPVNAGVQQSIAGFLVWDDAGFLNGGDANTVSLASGSSLSMVMGSLSGGGNTSFRAMLQYEGDWYLSEASFVGGTTTPAVRTIDLYATNWALWDADNTPLDTIPAAYSVSASTFAGIEAIGFYFSGARTNAMSILIDSVEITVNVVPEPSAMALLAAGGLILSGALRRTL